MFNLSIHFCSISENFSYKDGSRLFFKDLFYDFLISSLFKDLIVGDAVIQNPFEWKVVSVIFFCLMLVCFKSLLQNQLMC